LDEKLQKKDFAKKKKVEVRVFVQVDSAIGLRETWTFFSSDLDVFRLNESKP